MGRTKGSKNISTVTSRHIAPSLAYVAFEKIGKIDKDGNLLLTLKQADWLYKQLHGMSILKNK